MSPNLCPNHQGNPNSPTRIALIGERPGHDEIEFGQPFAGPAGRFLNAVLSSNNILRADCYIGNVSRAPTITQNTIHDGKLSLTRELSNYNPQVCVLLGQLPLDQTQIRGKISDYRGTIFVCNDLDSPFYNRLCVPTYNPAFLQRAYDRFPLFNLDISRAISHANDTPWSPTPRNFDLILTAEQVITKLRAIKSGAIISMDIEGGIVQGMSCVSIATSPNDAFIISFVRYGQEAEERVMKEFARVCADASIGKILQNALYDNFVLSWKYKCPIYGIVWDTMLSGWEIYPELPKGLGVQASIWTEEPFYKFERKVHDELTHSNYCCKDSAVTYEIKNKHEAFMSEQARKHFEFNMSLLPVFMYIELKGFKYAQATADKELGKLKITLGEIQTRINSFGSKFGLGEVNVNSPKQVCALLYDFAGYEKQHPKEGGRKNTSKVTSNVDALLTLSKKFSGPDNQIIRDLLAYRKRDKTRESLEIKADADGRVRGSYNVVGTDTGRLTSSKSPAGTGMNLQTVTKKLRHLFRADDGYHLFQCDLAGADGWTVAAHCKALGDDTMIKDYWAGIKPAKVIVLFMNNGAKVSRWSREQILEESKGVSEHGSDGWQYFACKRVQHGKNYGLGKIVMSSQIQKDSYNKFGAVITIKPKECERLAQLYMMRYGGITKWQNWVREQLTHKKALPCASGHIRHFFGRPTDHNTFRSALSHEPQANTTYATNLALSNLWNDPENRQGKEPQELIIQPLHQVHDAVIGQFPKSETAWATKKLRDYFNNTINIANQEIVIPFDGEYGPSWGELENPI